MFEPLLAAPPAIQFHAVAALTALTLGPLALFRRRRDRLHKVVGYIWVVAMAVTIATSFAIFEIRLAGPFSPIHLLSLLATYGLFTALRAAIRRDITTHQKAMRSLYFWALGIAGLFTLTPGRIMAQSLFADHQMVGFLGVLGVAAVFLVWRRLRHAQGLFVPGAKV
ncbi:MAG TPA: DUF2306 domain-containing protein [Aliiroseovarius sp.]|nr:DUF2306 domain-containing protein [Aliiroseovarius sp.]